MASNNRENVVLTSLQKSGQVTIDIDSLANSQQPLVDSDTFSDLKVYATIEEFNQNLPETVTLLKAPNGNNVYLVGTAHFSEESQKDVAFVIRNVRPRAVVVELCSSRVHILKHDEKTLLEEAKDINMQKVGSL